MTAYKLKFNFLLIQDYVYVPIYRDGDRGDVKYDKPSPKLLQTLPLSQTDHNVSTNRLSSSPLISNYTSQHKLAAYIGPISPKIAETVYERLKTPKLRHSPVNIDILRSDDLKGHERMARKIAEDLNIQSAYREYWSFLDNYYNLKSREGLDKLEAYLKQKKLQSIIDSQTKSAKEVLTERSTNKTNHENEDDERILVELSLFLDLVEQIKSNLELKENVLSEKFEKFISTIDDFASKNVNASLPLSLCSFLTDSTSIDSIENEILDENSRKSNEKLINELLTKYVKVIIELCRLDKTGKCHFNLYKPAKTLLSLLNCDKLFANFHLTPAFKRTTTFISNRVDDTTARIRKSIKYDSDDEEDEEKNSKSKKAAIKELNSEDEDNDDDNIFDDAEVSILEGLISATSLNDELDLLTQKLKSNHLNETDISETVTSKAKPDLSSVPLSNITNNIIKAKEAIDDDKLFLKPSSFMFSNHLSSSSRQQKLFIYGDLPSKLDRAVYFAIQDAKLDKEKHALVSEWLEYMKCCNQSEMQLWKTPMKQNPVSRIKRFD